MKNALPAHRPKRRSKPTLKGTARKAQQMTASARSSHLRAARMNRPRIPRPSKPARAAIEQTIHAPMMMPAAAAVPTVPAQRSCDCRSAAQIVDGCNAVSSTANLSFTLLSPTHSVPSGRPTRPQNCRRVPVAASYSPMASGYCRMRRSGKLLEHICQTTSSGSMRRLDRCRATAG